MCVVKGRRFIVLLLLLLLFLAHQHKACRLIIVKGIYIVQVRKGHKCAFFKFNFFKITFSPLVYENVCMIISFPTKRISPIILVKNIYQSFTHKMAAKAS